MTILDKVESLLREAIGLHTETVGKSVVQYALKQRMAACRLTDPSDYLRLVTSSGEELQELINAVIVPETWFLRDREAFTAMTDHALVNRRAGRPIRMLSLPCSTGEEPYSMAMAMFDAGFAAADFTIEGLDVSTHNIAEAVRAVYGRNSFRGTDAEFRARYFDAVDGGHRPVAMVLRQVRFKSGNLFDRAATSGAESYDIIFCRNLLIYFERELQERALDRLRELLAGGGLLLVGPGESGLPSQRGFSSLRRPKAFAFIKQDVSSAISRARQAVDLPTVKPKRPEPLKPQARSLPAKTPAPKNPEPGLARPAAQSAPAPVPDDPAQQSLRAIETAADAGRLEEVKLAARKHIETFGPSAGVFYLLGLAHDAGNAVREAIESYRKALYLAPDHRESLAHLSLLLERQGDRAGAKLISDRLGRIEKKSSAG